MFISRNKHNKMICLQRKGSKHNPVFNIMLLFIDKNHEFLLKN